MSGSDAVAALARLLERRGPALALTGAGCSTASGIPDYRDPDGNTRNRAPVTGQAFVSDPSARRRYWWRSFAGWPRFAAAAPNPAHRALAALERAGAVRAVVTQNVDGLHQQAGSRRVTDLHGRLSVVRCLGCEARFERDRMQEWLVAANGAPAPAAADPAPDGDAHAPERVPADFHVPACPHCHGVLKPDVVFFGENVDRALVESCTDELERAGVLLCVGTSLMVFSGFRFCRHAAARGTPIAVINRGRTRADDLLQLKLDAECGETLEALATRLGIAPAEAADA